MELDSGSKKCGNKWGNNYVIEDGVHPTPTGHQSISKPWLEKVDNKKNSRK
ncbi:hypothetical protein [Carnobacterium funditum]|uniref:hypothetical protein n=1 Tax=Carnobacterium funditum TaxID=2752 RepID=UPI000ACD9E0B|nr:hypothetical protein [Carnobacterium funditum]